MIDTSALPDVFCECIATLAPMQQQPRAKRVSTNIERMIDNTDAKWIAPCRLGNISVSGAQIELKRETELPRTFLLSLSRRSRAAKRYAPAETSRAAGECRIFRPATPDFESPPVSAILALNHRTPADDQIMNRPIVAEERHVREPD
jgi:hypothetical protein